MKTIKLSTRFRMAFKAFLLQPFDIQIEPFHYYCNLRNRSQVICDNEYRTGCTEVAKVCLMESRVKLEIVKDSNSYHLCHNCAEKYEGAKEKAG